MKASTYPIPIIIYLQTIPVTQIPMMGYISQIQIGIDLSIIHVIQTRMMAYV